MFKSTANRMLALIFLGLAALSSACGASGNAPADTVLSNDSGGQDYAGDANGPDLTEVEQQLDVAIKDGVMTCRSDQECDALLEGAEQCRRAFCNAAGECELGQAENESVCDDGNPCTTGDSCAEGVCTGLAKTCDDQGSCKVGTCNQESGDCEYVDRQDAELCDDGNVCTTGDACAQGSCVGTMLDCDDLNDCTQDGCNPDTGCVHTPVIDGLSCDDKDACTQGEICKAGRCLVGFALDCDDLNDCTQDSCNPLKGCDNLALSDIACDDQNPCTSGEQCSSGVCGGGAQLCTCSNSGDCLAYEDGNLCNGTYECVDSVCVIDPTTVVTCQGMEATECQVPACNPGTGICEMQNVADGTLCADGDQCTIAESCQAGACVAGAILSCGDGNSCTEDSCDPDLGCVHQNLDGTLCDDGNLCTAGDLCKMGFCKGGPNVCMCTVNSDCTAYEDGDLCNGTMICSGNVCKVDPTTVITCGASVNPCAMVSCNQASGQCDELPLDDGTNCDDGSLCTRGDYCVEGLCIGQELDCDDGNPCTDDLCKPAKGCTHSAVADGVCDDGDACTSGDTCKDGLCQSGSNICECSSDNDCKSKDDGNLCNGVYRCLNAHCMLDETTIVVCNDAQDSQCRKNTCIPSSGLCSMANVLDGTVCDDELLCTLSDVCMNGKCFGSQKICDDKNACTDDYCDPENGACRYEKNLAFCNDNDTCTVNDFCMDGVCRGEMLSCDDRNVCTLDYCLNGKGCQYKPISKSCDDGNACTTQDACSNGVCVGSGQLTCDDKVACTSDLCDSKQGCVFTNNNIPCNDGNACTNNDQCANGSCQSGAPTICNDNNPCTKDSCDTGTGCVFAPLDLIACTTGNACKLSGTCSKGVCKELDANCDDKNDCTVDACDPAIGCTHKNLTGDLCNDGKICTDGDHCDKGTCISSQPKNCDDSNVCTTDYCDAVAGCMHPFDKLENTLCDDANLCTEGTKCAKGICTGGLPITCDDNNPCTEDICDPAVGCVFTPLNKVLCDDGSKCTLDDVCVAGVCTGKPMSCTDNDPCTEDKCESATGKCFYPPVPDDPKVSCDDKNLCTKIDTCVQGVCVGASPVLCDDTKVCTTDTCDPAKGTCVFTNVVNGTTCDDKDACTLNETCQNGLCTGGAAVVCNDNNQCTTDLCKKDSGCIFTNSNSACEDGNPCTTPDMCSQGRCLSGPSTCECEKTLDCVAKEDGNLCNGTLICLANKCVVDPATIKTCPTNNDTTCVKNTCNPSDGLCSMVNVANGTSCDDKDACTSADYCQQGLCTSSTPVVCKEDDNPCTQIVCESAIGCVTKNLDIDCNDGNYCTKLDHCVQGVCTAVPVDCNDNNPCTSDFCVTMNNAPKCVYEFLTVSCNDGNACTVNDTCSAGNCLGTALSCDDGLICTDEFCDRTAGCIYNNNNKQCSDDNLCTLGDTCSNGVCFGKPTTCNDNKVCTDDSCDKATGLCVFTNNVSLCNDFDACTTGDICSAGVCKGPISVTCNDNNQCTDDTCVPATGCVYTTDLTNSCTDNDICTSADKCVASSTGNPPTCQGSRIANCCKTDADCPSTQNCIVGACNVTTNRCVWSIKDCNDNNDCTADSCVFSTGLCQNQALNAARNIYSEDFETSAVRGWLVGYGSWVNPPGSAAIAPDVIWHSTTVRNHSATRSFAANNPVTGTYLFPVAPAVPAYGVARTDLELPVVQLPNADVINLRFWRWGAKEANQTRDILSVYGKVSNTYNSLATYNQSTPNPPGWVDTTIDISKYRGQKLSPVFLFNTIDALENNFAGWHIDDVRIEVAASTNCCETDSNCSYATNNCIEGFCDRAYKCLRQDVYGSWLWERFESNGWPIGWTTTNNNKSLSWNYDKTKASSTPYAAYAGNMTTHTYAYGAGQMVLRTRMIDLTKSVAPMLTFKRYMDVSDNSCNNDILYVKLELSGGAISDVLIRCASTDKLWVDEKVELIAGAGKQVYLQFVFETLGGNQLGEGVYVDNIRVEENSALGQQCCIDSSLCSAGQACFGQTLGGYCYVP